MWPPCRPTRPATPTAACWNCPVRIRRRCSSVSAAAGGLSEAQASAARERHGRNEVDHEAPLRWYVHLWYSYRNPFNLLLTALASLSWVTDVWMAEPDDQSWRGVIIIGSMVVISTLLRFAQERRSNRAAEALKAMVQNTATVLRSDAGDPSEGEVRRALGVAPHASGSRRMELPLADLVPGDVVLLSAGDMILPIAAS